MAKDSQRGNMDRKILYTGEPLEVHQELQKLTVETRVPSKYLLIDTETGQVYRGSSEKRWKKLPTTSSMLKMFIKHVFGKDN